jgi:hypothetical protein
MVSRMSDKAWTRAARISKWICFLIAALWLGLIGFIQSTCSAFPSVVGPRCHDSQYADIWLGPVLFSPVGGLAVVASIIILISKR